MRPEVLIPIFASIPVGLAFFLVLCRSSWAHLRDWKDKLGFFLWPYPPSRMLIIQELDGEIHTYYDTDYEEIQSEDRTLIKTVDGMEYVTEVPPSEASIASSMFDAKAPPGIESPFGVAWRWVVAASILIFFIYFALVTAWIPPVTVQNMTIGGEVVPVAQQAQIDPYEALVATTAFFSFLTWMLSNIMRMDDRTIMLAWYHAKGINPPHVSIIPVPGMASISLLTYLEKLGRKINVVVPNEAADVINKAMKEVSKKVGSRSLAAIILAKLAIAKTWRQALAQVLRERFDLRKAGEASAMIRLGIQPISKTVIPAVVIALLVGVGIGYFIGNTYSFGVAPATNTTTTSYGITSLPTQTSSVSVTETQPAPTATTAPPTHTVTSTAGIKPASPPPPPTATSVGGVKP